MRLLIVLLVLLFAVPALGQIPTLRVNIYEPDLSLERFRLEVTVPQEDDEPAEEEKAPFWWRLAGYGVYAACGTEIIAQQYRKNRTFGGYDPMVGNDITRAFTTAGLTEGSNIGSEMLREKGGKVSKLALITRLGTLVGCTYAAAYNFNRGWKRR